MSHALYSRNAIGTIGRWMNIASDDVHFIYKQGGRFNEEKSLCLPGVPADEAIGFCPIPDKCDQ
jgi:hypothetical protein